MAQSPSSVKVSGAPVKSHEYSFLSVPEGHPIKALLDFGMTSHPINQVRTKAEGNLKRSFYAQSIFKVVAQCGMLLHICGHASLK